MGREMGSEPISMASSNALEQFEQQKRREEITAPILREARMAEEVVGTVIPRSKEIEELKKMEERSREAGITADYFHQLGNISSKGAKAKEPELSSADTNFLKTLRSQEAKAEFIVTAHHVWEAQALKREENKMMQAMNISPERIKEIESIGGFKGAESQYRAMEEELKKAVTAARKVHETDSVGQRVERTTDYVLNQAKDPIGFAGAVLSDFGDVAKADYNSISGMIQRGLVSVSGGKNAPDVGSPLITASGIVKPLSR